MLFRSAATVDHRLSQVVSRIVARVPDGEPLDAHRLRGRAALAARHGRSARDTEPPIAHECDAVGGVAGLAGCRVHLLRTPRERHCGLFRMSTTPGKQAGLNAGSGAPDSARRPAAISRTRQAHATVCFEGSPTHPPFRQQHAVNVHMQRVVDLRRLPRARPHVTLAEKQKRAFVSRRAATKAHLLLPVIRCVALRGEDAEAPYANGRTHPPALRARHRRVALSTQPLVAGECDAVGGVAGLAGCRVHLLRTPRERHCGLFRMSTTPGKQAGLNAGSGAPDSARRPAAIKIGMAAPSGERHMSTPRALAIPSAWRIVAVPISVNVRP